MTHIKWPNELTPPPQVGRIEQLNNTNWPNDMVQPFPSDRWYIEAMRQRAMLHQQSERASTAEARIAELALERDALLRVVTDNHVAHCRAEAAEAKLAKAVEALHFYADFYEAHNDGPWGVNSDDFGTKARAVLVELETGK